MINSKSIERCNYYDSGVSLTGLPPRGRPVNYVRTDRPVGVEESVLIYVTKNTLAVVKSSNFCERTSVVRGCFKSPHYVIGSCISVLIV